MIRSIIAYEIGYWFKQLTVYFYAGIMLMFGLSYILIAGDILREQTPDPYGEVFINTPIAIFSNVYSHLIILFLFLLPIIYGASMNRDINSNFYKVLYSYPIQKKHYFFGKFLSASLIAILIASCMAIGFIIGEFVPGLDPGYMGPLKLSGYLNVFLIYVIPNVLIFGSIVFSIVAATRNIYTGFVVVILIVILRMIIRATLGNIHYIEWAALLDPYGAIANMYYTHDWTIDQKNQLILPFKGYVIYNRLLWSTIAVMITGWGYRKFSLAQFTRARKKPSSTHIDNPSRGSSVTQHSYESGGPIVQQTFSTAQSWKDTWLISMIYLRSIVYNKSFLVLMIGIGVLMFILIGQVNPDMSSSLRPFTQVLLKIPMLFFSFVLTILTYVYSGFLIQRVRNSGMFQLVDASPVATSTLIHAKLLTLFMVQALLLSSVLIVGVIVQISQGHYLFDLSQYLFQLYGITFITLIIWSFASFFIHSLLGNQYIGIFLLLMIQIGIGALADLGLREDVFKFNHAPLVEHSDLSGYTNLSSYFIHKAYWLVFGILLLLSTYLIWQRGMLQSIKGRWSSLRSRVTLPFSISMVLVLSAFLIMGSWIYRETKADPNTLSSAEIKIHRTSLLSQYANESWNHPPRLAAVNVLMDIYPDQQRFEASAEYGYKHLSAHATDTLWISNITNEVSQFDLSVAHELITRDSILNVAIIALVEPLTQGDSIQFSFSINGKENTWLKQSSEIASNGTFIMPNFPNIGIPDTGEELFTEDRSYVFEDFLDYQATVSTEVGQTAITPGKLVKEWQEGDRYYFQYHNNSKVRNGFIYHSGAFDVYRDSVNGVGLEIYHHPTHDHNLESMKSGMKATIDFCERHFSPYQFDQMRIVEFPLTYGMFAQSFANTISYSEWAGFLINIDSTEEKRFSSPFRLTSHEIAHQWWGHQVVPANMPGSRFITEAMAEYISIKTLEEVHGPEKRDVLLDIERRNYFNGHNKAQYEQPLSQVPVEQAFVSYQKGSLALYAIGGYIGPNNLHRAMGQFLRDHRFLGPPYPIAQDMIDYIKAATPDSLRYLVREYLEDVILYDNRILSAQVHTDSTDPLIPEDSYSLGLDLAISKFRVGKNRSRIYTDSSGHSISIVVEDGTEIQSLPLSDYVELTIYGSTQDNAVPIYNEMILITDIAQSISITLTEKPIEIVIDAQRYLLDKNDEDNRFVLE